MPFRIPGLSSRKTRPDGRRRAAPSRWHAGALALSALGTMVVAPATGAFGATEGPVVSISTSPLPVGEVGVAFSAKLAATGGSAPYTWAVSSGTLPSGLTLATNGTISGTPKASASPTIVFSATDSNHVVGEAPITVSVLPGPSISNVVLPNGQVGSAYSVNMVAAGGVPPYSWSVASGPLPGGLLFSSSGVLSGRPGSTGTTTVTIKLVDALASSTTKAMTLAVLPMPPPLEQLAVVTTNSMLGVLSSTASPTSNPATSSRPFVGLAAAPGGVGYWAVDAKGVVSAFGAVVNLGSVARRRLAGRVVAIASSPLGGGYWIATSTGHVYGFGTAKVHRQLHHVAGRIVGIAAAYNGLGYWLVNSKGEVFATGAARRLGAIKHGKSGLIVGIAADPLAMGYLLVTRTGRVHAYGAAKLERRASTVGTRARAAGIAAAPTGSGYWVVTRSGVITAYGKATVFGTGQPFLGGVIGVAGAR